MGLFAEYYGGPDERDAELVAKRQLCREMRDEHNDGFSPASGDVVIFADGVRRRISHVWGDHGHPEQRVQTSDGGSWHWSTSGEMSFSGGLFPPVDSTTLTWDVAEYAMENAWIFHHDLVSAHRSVTVKARVRVWRCTLDANE